MSSFKRKFKNRPLGFSLTELMVAVGIIGVLLGVALKSYRDYSDRAKLVATMTSVQSISKMYLMHKAVTGKWGKEQKLEGGFLPKHLWGGAIRFRPIDLDGDNNFESAILQLDDDRPGEGANDNQGQIPVYVLQKIDEMYDDGDFSTGRIIGHGNRLEDGTNIVTGELAIFIE
jgi:prepilin-type N-terminal cleavage/methylation domain-containing protein